MIEKLKKHENLLAWVFLLAFTLFFTKDLFLLKKYLNHPEFVNYYHASRTWFLKNLLNGHFPKWNPYWGIGHTSEIAATFPIDLYSFLEILVGPKYHWFQPLQLLFLLGSAYWALRRFLVPPLLAAPFAVLFFLSPWTMYFYFYGINVNMFIGLILSFPIAYEWFSEGKRKSLFIFILVTALTFFGTKLELWFFHCVFFILFGCAAYFCIPGKGHRSLKHLLLFLFSLGFGIGLHAWQIVPLLQILRESARLEEPVGLRLLILPEFYSNLLLSFTQLSFSGFKYLISPFGLGALTTCLMTFKKNKTALLLFFPIAYYWCRPEPGDLHELSVLHCGNMFLRFAFGVAAYLGATQVGKNPVSKLCFILMILLFIARDQGQIFLAYLANFAWIPSRDNYLFDFLIMVMGALGAVAVLKKYSSPVFCVLIATVVVSMAGYLYYPHPLMKDTPLGFPFYEGQSGIREVIRATKDSAEWRGYFKGREFVWQMSSFGASLFEKAGQAHAFSSLLPKRMREWGMYQWHGILPSAKLSGYEDEYTDQTIAKLPKRNNGDITNQLLYWSTNHAVPPANPDAIRLLSVKHIISEKDGPLNLPELTDQKKTGPYFTARLKDTLPRAFLLPKIPGDKAQRFQEELKVKVMAGKIVTPELLLPFDEQHIEKYEEEYVRIHLKAENESLFVLTDLFHPFWRARLDGKEVSIQPALHIFRSIPVSAGVHTVEFYCEIPYFYWGLGISIVLALLFVACVCSKRFPCLEVL